MRRSFVLSLALSLVAFVGLAAPPPANAQAAVSLQGYVSSTGTKAVVRESTPLPTLTQPFVVPASRWQYAGATGGIVNTTAVALNAAAGAGIRTYVAAIQYFNSAAVASEIEIRDGSTVIWRGFVPASMTVPVQVVFPVPLRGTANTAMNVALGTTATATRVSAQGYVSPN
jgi:hypothetical protein